MTSGVAPSHNPRQEFVDRVRSDHPDRKLYKENHFHYQNFRWLLVEQKKFFFKVALCIALCHFVSEQLSALGRKRINPLATGYFFSCCQPWPEYFGHKTYILETYFKIAFSNLNNYLKSVV